MTQPWMKFYPQDWRADEKLRMCSLAARGLWMEFIALMHRSERYGHLLIGGRVPADAQLAVQVGALPAEVTALIAELEAAAVFSRGRGSAICSRRMIRDHKKAETARQNGSKGGNPALSGKPQETAENAALLNQPDNPQDNRTVKRGDKAQKPEARVNPHTPFQGTPEKPDGIDDQVWRDFLALRKRKRADLTQTALSAIEREAGAAGWSLADALHECIARGWQSFKADWVANPAVPSRTATTADAGNGTDAFIQRMEAFEARQSSRWDEAST